MSRSRTSREHLALLTVAVTQICRLLKRSGVCSILLLGSAARDELSFTYYADQALFLSDLEFMVVTESRVPASARARVERQLASLEHVIDPISPLFHIDVAFRERRRLPALPPIIFTFELKRNAKVLWGDDIRTYVPDVTAATLDIRNTNEILFKRLWAILLHVPTGLVIDATLDELERITFSVVCARNALDVSTVLLPHIGVLLPTYRDRVRYLKNRSDALPCLEQIDAELPAFLESCLEVRRHPGEFQDHLYQVTTCELDQLDPQVQLYRRTVEDLERALQYVGYQFNEWPISRGETLNLVRLAPRIAHQRGPMSAARWLVTSRKYYLSLGLLAMHQALLAYLAGSVDDANRFITETEQCLKELSVSPHSAHSRSDTERQLSHISFARRWLALRRDWAGVWNDLIRLGDKRHRRRIDRLLAPDHA